MKAVRLPSFIKLRSPGWAPQSFGRLAVDPVVRSLPVCYDCGVLFPTSHECRPFPIADVRFMACETFDISTTPGQGTQPTGPCRPRALTRRHLWCQVTGVI